MKIFYILTFVTLLPIIWFPMIIIWQNYQGAPKWFQYVIDKINE